MSEWRTVRLGNLVSIFDGPHATPEKTSAGPWFLSISSLQRGRLILSESAHLSPDDYGVWTKRVTPQSGDILFSYETRLGEAALMPAGIEACLGRRMGLLRPKDGECDSRFLMYAYLAPQFQAEIQSRSIHGATVDRIPLTELADWPISVPDLRTQRALAEVLGALDDKIAVNERIAATASDLIEQLYRQSLSRSQVKEVALEEFVRMEFGQPYSSKYFNGQQLGRPLLRIRDLHTASPAIFTAEQLPGDVIVHPGDVVVGMDAEFRPSFWLGEPALLNQRVLRVTTTGTGGPCALRESLRGPLATIERGKSATTVIHLNKSDLVRAVLRVPAEGDLELFESRADPLRCMIVEKSMESRALEALRDTLLPKLMAGEIQVRDAERRVGEVV